ncbi:MAG: M14 family metallopeptidase [Krumholzibacteria bacterium]|nr:M14 family metallopeptidase [Candidatus Krumholzibacteria bacterium]
MKRGLRGAWPSTGGGPGLVLVLVLIGLSCGFAAVARAGGLPPTPWAASGGLRTPRYAETVAWCEALAAVSDQVQLSSFGTSGQGRPLPLVVWDRQGRFTPGRRDGQAVVLLQACIHAGESCGKDAGMELLRDLVEGRFATDHGTALDSVTILFIPIFNADGHERFGPWGRINQNGPLEMGWRTNAANLNLNRDYVKADTPELRAWLGLWRTWRPDFFIDTHSTDGADYQYAVTYSLDPYLGGDPDLTAWIARYEGAMKDQLAADGWPLFPYVTFRRWHDPRSGLRTWAATPRYSQGYAAVRNRPGLLIEAHMLKDYPTRVEATGALVGRTLAWVDAHAGELTALNTAADARAASPAFRAAPFPLRYRAAPDSVQVDFLGVAYEERISAVTGGAHVAFGDRPETWRLWSWPDLEPAATARLPEAYLVPPEWTEVIDRLDWHGVAYRRLAEPVALEVRTWRLDDPRWQERPYEGRHPVSFTAVPLVETRLWPAGTVVVDLAQPAAPLVAHLLEPEAPDALVQWGFFDPVFTRTEYVESYVIEAMIPQLLADNPGWAAELEARKAADPAFAADPGAIRHWFYARTPWYDGRAGIYPVACLDGRGVVDGLPLR